MEATEGRDTQETESYGQRCEDFGKEKERQYD